MVRMPIVAAIGLPLATSCAFAGDIDDRQVMKPMHAVSADFGERHFVSFFTTSNRHCDLTVVSVSRMEEGADTAPDDVQRLRVVVSPQDSARIDAPNAGMLEFACWPDASRMVMTTMRRVAEN